MSHTDGHSAIDHADTVPGGGGEGRDEIASGLRSYLIGLALAVFFTLISFYLPTTNLVWGPGIGMALVVFAIAQMGVHLVFFLHITTSPDNTNNVLALAFGVLIVFLIMGGSVWIMAHLNNNMMPTMDKMMQMQR